jgi:hypothetical protein
MRAAAKRAENSQLLDFFVENSWRNAYGGELEVRPPDAPAITPDEIRSLSMLVGTVMRTEGPRASVAVVAPDDALFGIMRMYQTLCDGEGFAGIGVSHRRGCRGLAVETR